MIRINDKWDIAWKQGMRVEDVLEACGFSHQHLVVSVNGKLVPPDQYARHQVTDGDRVRVVHIIGGGL